jgi:hypothetical protein
LSSHPFIQFQTGPSRYVDLAGTTVSAGYGDLNSGYGSGGVMMDDDCALDQTPIAHAGIGARAIDAGKWDAFPAAGGSIFALNDVNAGLAIYRLNAPAGTSGLRSRKLWSLPTKIPAGNAIFAHPWSGFMLEMMVKYSSIQGAVPAYQFGMHSNNISTDMAGGSMIGFRVGVGAIIQAVVRNAGVGETAQTLGIATDTAWHLYWIMIPFAENGVDPATGPSFWVDRVLQHTVATGIANLPRGPMHIKFSHAAFANPNIEIASVRAGHAWQRRRIYP